MQGLAYLKHAGKLFFKKNALPEQVTFFVTPRCNARCKHCFASALLRDNDKDALTLREIEKISRTMGHFTYLLIGGGEPFLRDDLAEIVRIFCRNNRVLNVAISTNGSLPQVAVKTVKEILSGSKNNLTVNVSFDAIADAHDEIRQSPGIFKKAVETYIRLKGLKSEYPLLNAGIIMTCSPYNHKALSETYQWLKENLKPYSIVLNFMRGDVRDEYGLSEVELAAYEKVMRMIEEDNLSGDIPGHSNFFLSDFNLASKMVMREVVCNTAETQSFQLPCFAGILNCVLWYNGDVYPCEMLDRKMGNLRQSDYDFRKVWNSLKAQQIRDFIRESRCFCTEECNININILFNPRYLHRLLGNVARIQCAKLRQRLRR